MSIFRRTSPSSPQRRPHPDPRVETTLQRIIDLQRIIARKQGQLDDERHLVAELRQEAGTLEKKRWGSNARGLSGQADKVIRGWRELEADITAHHEAIGKIMAGMDDSDLAYL